VTRFARILAAVLAAACLFAVPASAARHLTIRGRGFGHGVGMSQYGAYGYALHGWGYQAILAHYYTGTGLGLLPSRSVRVLLEPEVRTVHFSNARRAAGRTLKPGRTYGARAAAGAVSLLSPHGKRLATVAAPLRVKGAGAEVLLQGTALNGVTDGVYRGSIELRPSGSGLEAVNALDLESYVRGVVADESPASWPIEALKAQAVAARTYAVTTSKGGDGWDQYPDTRSQMYGGVSAETAATDAAVAATRKQVVTYAGQPAVTYFFSTSGGRTENVENSMLGAQPEPWLKSVRDPYDSVSPLHRWAPIRMSLGAAGRKLHGLVKGRFRSIKVVKRGVSPRIVLADVVGSRGRTRVTGPELRDRFGLRDTWASFRVSGAKRHRHHKPKGGGGGGTGGSAASLGGSALPASAASLVGG
jgi:stage II sporulation protein D